MQRIRLDYYPLKLQTAQQLLLLRRSLRLEGGSLAGLVGVVSLLRQGNSLGSGIDRDLDNVDEVGRRPYRWLPSSVSMAEPRNVLPWHTNWSKLSVPHVI